MYNILFVCYGNICRSPMAEMIFKNLIYTNSKRYMFTCASRATSMEELGNPMYPQAINILNKKGIKIENHVAKQITKEDYNKYDLIIVFEERNKRDILRIVNEDPDDKIHLIMEYTTHLEEVDDPWYTNDFEKCYNMINEGCNGLYNYLLNKEVKNDY